MGISALKSDPPRAAEILEEHRALASALAAGDQAAAPACIGACLDTTKEILRGRG
jgi:DNA-binding FadR family transcriptional regulator